MEHQSEEIWRWPEVKQRVPLHEVTVYRLEKAGNFPRRRKLTSRSVGWFRSEIEAWLNSRPQAA